MGFLYWFAKMNLASLVIPLLLILATNGLTYWKTSAYYVAHCEAKINKMELEESRILEQAQARYETSRILWATKQEAIERQLLERDQALEKAINSSTSSNVERLRVVYKRAHCSSKVPSSTTPTTDSTDTQSTREWELWQRAAVDLTKMATRADQCANQLNACQQYVEELRNVQDRN